MVCDSYGLWANEDDELEKGGVGYYIGRVGIFRGPASSSSISSASGSRSGNDFEASWVERW